MSIAADLYGFVRGTATRVAAAMSTSGEVMQRKSMPDFLALVNENKVWKVQDLTTTVVLNAVLPTTTAGLTVQNPTSDKYYIVFAVTAIVDVAPASIGSVSFSHAAHKAPVAALTRDVALTAVGGMKGGQGAYSGSIILDRGATVVDDGWTPIGSILSNVVNSQTWMSTFIPLVLPVIIPPLTHWSIGATGNSATFEAGLGLVWAEVAASEL